MHPALLPPVVYFWLIPLLLIDLVLKGMALWRSAQRKQLGWFILLLVINSVGILPLIYLLIYGFGGKKRK
jgi:methionyl-tRNA synthetase